MKNGKLVKLPVARDLQSALDALPEPIGSIGESKYFFWSGNGTVRSMKFVDWLNFHSGKRYT